MKKTVSKKRALHPVEGLNQQDAREHAPTNRPVRVPLYRQKVVDLPKRAGFVNRFVLDTPGRIEGFLKAGWSFIMKDGSVTHDGTVSTASQMGSAISRILNTGSDMPGKIGYGMEIPETFYNEDQAKKLEKIERDVKAAQASLGANMVDQEYEEKYKMNG